VRRLLQVAPTIEIIGIGGPKMAAAGCRLIADATERGQVGLGAIRQVWYFRRLFGQVEALIEGNRPDIVVVCDSPSFNFHVARIAKARGIKTVFYVAPQLWAWGAWRAKRLRALCDKLCCILPFEKGWFEARGIPATFVGHPMLEQMADLCGNMKSYQDLTKRGPRIAIMPGSRTSEIRSLWPAMQQIAIKLRQVYPSADFTAVAVNKTWQDRLQASQDRDLQCHYSIDTVYQTAKASDLALVASGSATVEVAAAGCPMVVMYQTNRIAWHLIGRWLVRPRYFCLVNLIADRPLVREFVPYFHSIDPIVEHTLSLLADRLTLERLSRDLIETVLPLGQKKASVETCRIVLEGLGLPGPLQGAFTSL